MKHYSSYPLLATLSICMLLPLNAGAASDDAGTTPDTSKWVCKYCPAPTGWIGNLNLGLIWVDDPTPKFADYRGLIDDGTYVEASGDSRYRNDKGYYFDFYARDLGLDSRALEMRGGKQGLFELRLDYNEIPRYLGHGTSTPYLGVGTDTLVLPESPQMTAASLESKRKTIRAGLTFKIASSWKVNADVEQQKRNGTRSFSGGLFAISGTIFPAPIDYTTNLFNTGLEFSGKRSHLRLEFLGSDFNNGNDSVTWDNPFATGWGDDVSRSALEPDNKYYQVNLAGAFKFSPRFRVSGKASFGNVEQNAAFLPYSINPKYEDLALPRSSLDGKLETSMFNLSGRLYIRLADRLDLTAQYKTNQRDNKTPVDTYTPVLLEVFTSSPRSNRPYSYDRDQAKLELRYRPRHNIRLNAGFKRDVLERTYQDVIETEEDTYWGELQFSSWAWLGARLKFDQSNRDSEVFEEQGNYDRAENPLMRKFNMAERDRKRITVEFDLTPVERFNIALSIYTTDDEYDASVIGLTEGEETSYNLDLNYIVNKHTNIYAFASKDQIESRMSAAGDTDAVPWNATTEDEIITWGLGISGQINEKITYGFDYISSDSDGNILTDSGAGEAPFPVLTTTLRQARIFLNYKISDRWGLGLDAYNEQYDSDDWYVDGIGPLDIDGILNMGEISPDYDVNVVRLLATLNF